MIELFSDKNIKILNALGDGELHIREISRKVGCSSGTAMRAIKLFRRYGIVKGKKLGNMIKIALNYESPLLRSLRACINLHRLLQISSLKDLLKEGVVGVYGSFASGVDKAFSDIDLWILTKKGHIELQDYARDIGKKLNRKVNLLVLTQEKIKSLRNNDYEFYIRLKLTSIILNGGDIFD